MTGSGAADVERRGPARRAVTTLFAVNGVAVGTFLARIPVLKSELALSEGVLGAILLGPPLGTIVAILAAGSVLGTLGTRRTSHIGIAIAAIALVAVGLADGPAALFAALTFLGAGLGAMDLAMNARGSDAEQRAGTSLMVGFHGAWSVGALVGGGVASLSIAASVTTSVHLVAIAVIFTVAAAAATAASDTLGRGGTEPAGPRLALPRGVLVPLAAGAMAATLAEGAVGDWAGVFVAEHRGASAAVAAAAFVAFSAAMATSRLVGDRIVRRVGARRVAQGGGALATAGFLAAVGSPDEVTAIMAFGIVGLGVGPLFPLLLADAGRRRGGHGIAAVSAVGYTGLVLGPPLIGFSAEATSLPTSLLGVSLVAAVIVLVARRLPTGS